MLPHLAARLFGTPLLVNRAKLDIIIAAIGQRLGLAAPAVQLALPPPRQATPAPTGIAVLPIHGTLVKRTLGLEAESGLASYEQIGRQLEAALADPQVAGILLDVDSPGGETGGVFELARAVRAATKIKPVWAVANDAAFSAAYAIASSASRLIVTETGGVGSIGVIALHIDQSVKDANDGYRYTAITAGAKKNDFSPHEPLDDAARAELQTEVDRLYDLFLGHVAAMRGLDAATVRATEAGLFFGDKAVAANLADAVMSLDAALASFAATLNPQGRSRSPARAQSQVGCASLLEEPAMQNEAPQEMIAADEASAQLSSVTAEVRREVAQSAQAIAEMCLIAGQPAMAADFIAQGKTEAEVRRLLVEMKAASQSPEIVSTLDPDKAAAVSSAALAAPGNPLIAAVKHLIGKE